jgi:hypothetical protein
MQLPLYQSITEEQKKQFGSSGRHEVLATERHVYTSPFMYDNVKMGDFYEIDPTKGVELKADTGYITIAEDKPIVAVTVVGGGCYAQGYNICEWWSEEETIDNLKDQLVKRQRIDHLNGIHPSIFMQLMINTFPGLTYRDVAPGEITGPADCLKKYTDGYYGDIHLGFYENTALFKAGPPYPHKVTIRGGCMLPEVPGMNYQPRADYAFRVVETTVIG